MIKESKLQYKILRFIESNFKDSVCFKIEKASKNGVADIWYAIPGYPPTFAEIKRDEKEKLRPTQAAMRERMLRAGQRAIAIKSWDQWMEEVRRIRTCYQSP
jgi:hypothetical protein